MSTSTTLPSQTNTQILIVGAGPTGLVTAISLAQHGVSPQDITVVDSLRKGENSSRATVIHAGTLEALDAISSTSVVEILRIGIKGIGEYLTDRHGTPIFKSSFPVLASYTKYPFFVALSQAITERILVERAEELGIVVHRPFKVIGMMRNEEAGGRGRGGGLKVTMESGQVITTNYVIGADGAKSMIRESAEISFGDPNHPGSTAPSDYVHKDLDRMIMADVSFDPPYPSGIAPDIMAMTPSDKGLFLTLPLDSDTGRLYGTEDPVYRIGFTIPSDREAPSYATKECIEEYINRQGPYFMSSDEKLNPSGKSVRIGKVHWSSRFRLRSAVADTFSKRIGDGIVLLVGDAGHIHPPAGGQGMNLGIRDSIGLGKVLAEHVKKFGGDYGRESEEFEVGMKKLEAYAASRRERALKVIGLTKVLVKAATGVVASRLFAWGLGMISMLPLVQKTAAWNMSGLEDKVVDIKDMDAI
ncbi:hypothetical protein D9758_009774 [Tetrapyrgos nigripes]|uniref:FAD-binding domain-containing protein n=1 Tax=Tetrapyrgos nigripes TaxID=182062 RepID=A0A8H5GKG5_9AGAR|nr:hypothetical protein D9758_009774 [Tetrapyrgos nigripes]